MSKIIKAGIPIESLDSCICDCGCEFKVEQFSEIIKGTLSDAKLKCPHCGTTGHWDLIPGGELREGEVEIEVPVVAGSKNTEGISSLWLGVLAAVSAIGLVAFLIWLKGRPQ